MPAVTMFSLTTSLSNNYENYGVGSGQMCNVRVIGCALHVNEHTHDDVPQQEPLQVYHARFLIFDSITISGVA